MSDRYGSYPPDEPVIGANYPPAPSSSGYRQRPDYGGDSAWSPAGAAVIGADTPAAAPANDGNGAYAGDYNEYDPEYDDGYYGDDYYDDAPTRQPAFYIFIALAVLLGGGLIFVLFSLFGGNGDDDPSVPAGFNVLIDSPVNNDRIEISKPKDINVRATSNEQITRFELFVADKLVDQFNATAPGANNEYSATLKHTFDRTGEYKLFVRVMSVSGATRDSETLKIVAIQSVGDKPVKVKGRVNAAASVRKGPNEDAEVLRTLNPGEEVTIIGKTRDSAWLLLEGDNGWVRKEAIELFDSLALVPAKDPTPTPAPATPTAVATPSTTPPPTTNPNAPDFVPVNALVIDGGATLRVTIQNLATAPFTGPLVVGVAKVGVASPQRVVDASIPANGKVTVDFELTPPITQSGSSVQVTVDPGNVVKESNEDNNGATFVLTPAAESPNITIDAPGYAGAVMNVTIRNTGGPLSTSSITVSVEQGGSAESKSTTAAMAKNGTLNFSFAKPAAGPAKIRVLISGAQVSAVDIEVP